MTVGQDLSLADRLRVHAAVGQTFILPLTPERATEIADALDRRDGVIRAEVEACKDEAIAIASDTLLADLRVKEVFAELRREGRDRLRDKAMRIALHACAALALADLWQVLVQGVAP